MTVVGTYIDRALSAKEHISEGPEGIIMEAMLEGYAEFYSAELSEKIHRGQKENALKGKNNGGGVPLGYLLKKRKYVGEYRYQNVVIEGGVHVIIPEDLFNCMQERMEKKRHAPAMAKAKADP